MKSNFVSQWIGAGALALSLAVLPSALPASAQTTTDPVDPTTPSGTAPAPTTTIPDTTTPDTTYSDPVTTDTADDNDSSWGWLGLLGLLGLGGLAGRKSSRPTTTYRTDDRVVTPTSSDPRI